MTNTHDRLVESFANVFPDLPPAQIPLASTGTVKEWDSVAHITLLSAIAEDLGIELDTEDFVNLTSFSAIEAFAARKLAEQA